MRRHLTTAQRRALGLKLQQRGWSSPRIAQRLGVSDQTVLNDLAATSKNLEVGLPARIIGKDGGARATISWTACECRSPARRPPVCPISSANPREKNVLSSLPSTGGIFLLIVDVVGFALSAFSGVRCAEKEPDWGFWAFRALGRPAGKRED